MLKTTLVFDDGTVISSGQDTVNAVRSVRLTQSVNAGTELTLGSVCSAMLEADIIAPQGAFAPMAGQQVTLYRDGVQMGIFILEKPTRASANLLKLTGYDRVSLLDRDLSGWVESLVDWPYSLYKFAWMVCAQCGLELESDSIPNGDYPVEKFSAAGITGRQLLSWVGEAAGRFCTATAQGKLCFDWYTPGQLDGVCFENSLRFEDYTVAPIDRVQISLTQEDVGVGYPDVQGNTYVIRGNYLLTGEAGLQALAQNLYTQLSSLRYTPCQISVPAQTIPRAGQILEVTDANGVTVPFLVMRRVQSGQKDTLECTGSPSRESTSFQNQQTYKALSGRVLELSTQVSGLRAENRDAQNNAAALSLEVEGIRTQVQQQSASLQQLTALEQTARQLQLSVQTIQNEGASKVVTTTGFTFDESGLKVEKTGSDLQNRIDQSGMQVLRGSQQVLLRADVNGVLASDVQVHNYLIVGDHARFEDYAGNRTACYYIGG